MSMTSAGVRRLASIPKPSISMKNDCFAADGLAALLASCSPVNFQGIEQTAVSASQKRSRHSIFETSEETGDEDGADDYNDHVEKKKRLSSEQVKALEKSFQLENKLEPERKLQLAQELRLQPRQVAVWFQNRRARWKTKQLEKDYDILKSDYEILRADFDALLNEKGNLENQVMELNEKLRQRDEKVSNILGGKGVDPFKRPEVSIKLEKDVQTALVMTDISVLPLIGKMCPQSVCLTGLTDLAEVKEGTSTSDSDSEILDVATPKLPNAVKNALLPELQHHISSEILVLGGLDVGLLQLGEDVIYERVFPQIYQVHAMKQDDVADKDENGRSLLTIEDQAGSFSFWDW